jgi:chromatin remodeling complex protein RSC6
MEEPTPATFSINTDDSDTTTIDKQMKIEIITSSQPQSQPQSETTTVKTIEILNNNIKTIETLLVSMKKQLNCIEATILQQEKTIHKQNTTPALLIQPKIKDTSLFKESNQKKIKLDVGFNIQRSITPELCDFMKLEKGSMTTFNDATKYIINYINKHKLQNPTMRKFINPDDSLCKLFNLSDKKNNSVTYFNLPKYIHPHFID